MIDPLLSGTLLPSAGLPFAANATGRQTPVKNWTPLKNQAQISRQYCKHLEMKLF
jgi:hypothetical protein